MSPRSNETVGGKDAARAIVDSVNKYAEDIREAIYAEIENTAVDIKDGIRSSARKKTGRYSRGWTIKRWSAGWTIGRTVHNAKVPGLPHLLEHGHAKRGGGRVAGDGTISRVTGPALEDLERKIVNILERGGKR